jgi:predicted acyltransferase (DUF342 family)
MRSIRSIVHLLMALSLMPFLCAAAFGDGSHDRTQAGRNITIPPDEEASDVTCFGCSVRVIGHVASDVTTFGGNVIVEDQGEVDGDITTFAGSIRLDKEVKVGGDVTVFGGHIRRDPASAVGGDLTSMSGWAGSS